MLIVSDHVFVWSFFCDEKVPVVKLKYHPVEIIAMGTKTLFIRTITPFPALGPQHFGRTVVELLTIGL